jgi:hypothetical protein
LWGTKVRGADLNGGKSGVRTLPVVNSSILGLTLLFNLYIYLMSEQEFRSHRRLA